MFALLRPVPRVGLPRAPFAAVSSSSAASPTRRALNKFLLRVHPDRFHANPEQRLVNQRSLGQLNEWLDAVRRHTEALREPDGEAAVLGPQARATLAQRFRVNFFMVQDIGPPGAAVPPSANATSPRPANAMSSPSPPPPPANSAGVGGTGRGSAAGASNTATTTAAATPSATTASAAATPKLIEASFFVPPELLVPAASAELRRHTDRLLHDLMLRAGVPLPLPAEVAAAQRRDAAATGAATAAMRSRYSDPQDSGELDDSDQGPALPPHLERGEARRRRSNDTQPPKWYKMPGAGMSESGLNEEFLQLLRENAGDLRHELESSAVKLGLLLDRRLAQSGVQACADVPPAELVQCVAKLRRNLERLQYDQWFALPVLVTRAPRHYAYDVPGTLVFPAGFLLSDLLQYLSERVPSAYEERQAIREHQGLVVTAASQLMDALGCLAVSVAEPLLGAEHQAVVLATLRALLHDTDELREHFDWSHARLVIDTKLLAQGSAESVAEVAAVAAKKPSKKKKSSKRAGAKKNAAAPGADAAGSAAPPPHDPQRLEVSVHVPSTYVLERDLLPLCESVLAAPRQTTTRQKKATVPSKKTKAKQV